MGTTVKLRDTFNRIADGRCTAVRCLLGYGRDRDGNEVQVLMIEGHYADGSKLEIRRECKANANLEAEVAAAARSCVERAPPPI